MRSRGASEISRRSFAGAAFLAALTGACLAGPTRAQEVERIEFVNRRALGGHTFIPTSLAEGPFITSYVRSSTGLGVASDLQIPVRLPGTGEVLTVLDGSLVFLLLEFEYQQAFGSWIAFKIGGSASARLGTNEESILAQGITALYGMNLGTTVKLWRTERLMVSAVGDWRRNQVYAFSLFDFLENVLDDGFDPGEDNSLVESGPVDQFTGGLRAAYAPWRWLGLTGQVEGGGGSPFREELENQGVIVVGGSAGADLADIASIPIGIQWATRWANFSDKASDRLDSTWNGGLTVGYTGRKDFFVGLRASFNRATLIERIPGTESNTLDSTNFELLLRYFF